MAEKEMHDRLRELIVGEEIKDIEKLKERLDDQHAFSKDVSKVLPEAFKRATEQSDQISKSMVPTIERTIFKSVAKDPRPMADALFPIIGPAIRKSIGEALKALLQNLNRTLENSLSFRSIKWRFEAMISRRSYAEIIVAKSLIYRVREVFLIHREQGILLNHLHADTIKVADGDMVSGMLTAIRDFVADSFNDSKEGGLDTIQVGELTVWIEQGPKAILAGVIDGQPPETLRNDFKITVENIHETYALELDEFEGDTSKFEAAEVELKEILSVEYKQKKKRKNIWGWAFVIILLLGVAAYSTFRIERNIRWQKFVNRIKAQEGILIAEQSRVNNYYLIEGLKDPLAEDPAAHLSKFKFDTTQVKFNWQAFQSLSPAMLNKRINKIFNPPPELKLNVENGILYANGIAPFNLLSEINAYGPRIDGIAKIDISNAKPKELIDFERLKVEIESAIITFEMTESGIAESEISKISDLTDKITALDSNAQVIKKPYRIEIIGYTDLVGTDNFNMELSQKRSETVYNALRMFGVPADSIETVGKGYADKNDKHPRRVEIHIKE